MPKTETVTEDGIEMASTSFLEYLTGDQTGIHTEGTGVHIPTKTEARMNDSECQVHH